jgi:outer membrane protein, heavy metal efflux system
MTASRLTRSAACMLFTASIGWLLPSCAIYHRAPLASRDVENVLASPDRAVLERQASQLSHPYIAPVTLDFSRPLTADEIAVIAVIANPDLRALRARQGVADAQVFAAGLLPDPQISFGVDKVLAPADPALSTAFTGTLSLDLLGPLATRRTERETAQAAARKVRLDIAWQEWLTAGQARLLAMRTNYQGESAHLAREASDVSEHSLQRALAALAGGDLKQDEIEARRIAAAENFARALAAERDYESNRLDLNRLLGLKPLEALDLAAATPADAWQAPDPEQLFAESRTHRLDLQALAAGYDSQESAVHRAVLGQYPRLAITLNRARDTTHVDTIGPAVSLDLPLWNRNRGTIAVATADRAQLRAEYAARLHQTRADIAALVAALTRDEQARNALQAQVPKIEQVARALESAAQRGDVTLPVAEAARAAATDKHLALIALEQTCAEQRLALTLAVGRPITQVR